MAAGFMEIRRVPIRFAGAGFHSRAVDLFLAFVLFLATAPVLAGPSINSGSPAYPFPQNATYPYGIKPNHKTAAAFETDVRTMYTTYSDMFLA